MSDPIIRTFLKIRQVNKIILDLQVPRRGYFVGTLFMMLAKVNDVYCLMSNMMRDIIMEQPDPDLGHVEINFLTESRQPGQTANEAKNSWECRSPKVLQEPIRKYWSRAGQMPCFYEYFLISHPWEFPRPPVIISKEIIWKQATHSFPLKRFNIQQQIAVWSAESMTRARWNGKRTKFDYDSLTIEPHWEHVYYDGENLMSRFQFWLDNLPGPTGGHMDMLRLHRFKTMDKYGAGIFARQNQNYPKSGGPYGASTEINRRLATLFDPFAASHIIEMRDSCPHFRAVKWATASLSKHTKQMSDEARLKFYPQGIRYYWDSRNLIEWRLHWTTRNYSLLEKFDNSLYGCNNVLLHQWWECAASYRDSWAVLNELALPVEREALQWAIKSFPNHPADIERPVLVRRDRDEYIVRVARKDQDPGIGTGPCTAPMGI
ncbi:hypothetical protein ACHAO7_003314 [Fusarium culmorum]